MIVTVYIGIGLLVGLLLNSYFDNTGTHKQFYFLSSFNVFTFTVCVLFWFPLMLMILTEAAIGEDIQ